MRAIVLPISASMSVIGIAGQRVHMGDELAALGVAFVVATETPVTRGLPVGGADVRVRPTIALRSSSSAFRRYGGRGPGSGVRLTAESLAMLLTAILATASLSEMGTATRLLARAKRSRISAEEEKAVWAVLKPSGMRL